MGPDHANAGIYTEHLLSLRAWNLGGARQRGLRDQPTGEGEGMASPPVGVSGPCLCFPFLSLCEPLVL